MGIVSVHTDKHQKLKQVDVIGGIVFAVLTVALITVFFTNSMFFEWAFARHHNTLSWYIRPLFIIPIALGAFKRSYTITFASIFCLFTSMFWFPEPAVVDKSVDGFLNFEKTYLTSGWSPDKIVALIAIILFFIFLISTTWNRKWKWLLVVIAAGAVLKVIHSLVFSGEDALSIVKPAVLGLILCVAAVVFFVRRRSNADNAGQ